MADVPDNLIFRWEPPTYLPDARILDGHGGRYLVRRRAKGSREFRAFFNGQPTSFYGSREEVMKMVERTITAALLKEQGKL